jgi:hypothetical protein
MPQDRYERALKTVPILEKAGIKLGRYAYMRLPYVFVEDAIKSNSSLSELNTRNRSYVADEAIRIAESTKIRDSTAGYGWVSSFKLVEEEPVKPVMDFRISPVSSLDPILERLYCHIGIINSTSVHKISPARLLGILKQDPLFRKDIRDESIIEILANDKLLGNHVAIEMVLIGIGARPDLAAQVANLFVDRSQSFLFRTAIGGISLGDPAISGLDLSHMRHMQLVEVQQLRTRELPDLLRLHGMAFLISEAFRRGDGVPRHVRVELSSLSEHVAMQKLVGSLIESASRKYNKLYPNRVWSSDI